MSDGFDFDLFVIGGGSGGVRAARIAAAEGGARVALAEQSRMGGTCVIRGCVPKKLMVFASNFPAQIADARAYGWDVQIGALDWPQFRQQLAGELARLEGAYRATLASAGVQVMDARAELAGAHTVRLADGRSYTAKHILIATGARPYVPEIPGADLALTSDAMFDLPNLPARALVVGGGYIACEFASLLAGMGVAVTLAYRGAQILGAFDAEAREHLAAALMTRGIDLRLNTDITALSRGHEGGPMTASLKSGDAIDTDLVLFATGRLPNTAGLGLGAVNVPLGPKGQILVDDYSQTAVPSIFAVGDVTDQINLTPVAIAQGHAFADTVFRGIPNKADLSLVPSAVFTTPELASVGLSEQDAAAKGRIDVYSATFRPMRTLFAGRHDRMLMKLVVDAGSQRVLGCHIVGDGAAELVQIAAIALKVGATKADFNATMALHPTVAEELVTMRRPTRSLGGAV